MCVDSLCGSGGESSSGPTWEMPGQDRDLVSNVLLSMILSRVPTKGLGSMLGSSDSGLGQFLTRVYGGPSESKMSAWKNMPQSDMQRRAAELFPGRYGPTQGQLNAEQAANMDAQKQGLSKMGQFGGTTPNYQPGAYGYNIIPQGYLNKNKIGSPNVGALENKSYGDMNPNSKLKQVMQLLSQMGGNRMAY